MREITIAIVSPYLTDNLERMIEKFPSKEEFLFQMEKAKYMPNNLHGVSNLKTRRNLVSIIKPEQTSNGSFRNNVLRNCVFDSKVIFSISGSTADMESQIKSYKGSGVIVARYSIFYGKSSGYTGRSPAESGYSLDIPKDPEVVRMMLIDDDFLEAISDRDEKRIKEALENLNKRLHEPILATGYLAEALKSGKK